jgi:cof-like hydrolase
MKKLIVSDMDGTLLKSDKTISQDTIEIVNQVRKQGIEFTIGTGRIYPVVTDTIEKMSITAPLILCNGAIIQDPITRQIYYSKPLNNNIAISILDIVKNSGLYFYYYTQDSINAREVKYITASYLKENEMKKRKDNIKINITDDLLSKAKNDEVFKIVVINEDHQRLEKIKDALFIYEDYITVTSSYWNNIEIVANNVNKGTAVKYISEHFGYDIKDIMCIGDEENDESMLSVAGFAVAMGNANEQMKKIAHYITSDNDSDGMVRAIQKFAQR